MQSARLPYKVGYSLLSGVRLIPQLFNQFQQMRKAIIVRSGGSRVSAVEQMKLIMIPILAGNIRNAHRLAAAMEAKGFTEDKRTFYYSDDYSKRDVYYLIYAIFCFVIVSILSTYYPIFPIDNVMRL
ncbi:energy-coupling factor transporter transmembrane component T family protein [Bacillus coahuilensis]|uniref:energy-coupling factor transporter transmembrane component T family protein n=1 Tax=Bacillus coahuilensis TaxID=408580 RepID=UPI0001850DA7|nr:energy-coupling factor transporter transmembrane component T [Bacillus coahuilensis]